MRLFERAAGLRVDGVLTQREVRVLKKAARSGGMAGAVSPQQSGTTARAAVGSRPRRSADRADRAAASGGGAGRRRRPRGGPAGAPAAVAAIIQAGNVIAHMPYRFGGGHQSWKDSGYDCSGSVSFALHGAGLLDTPLASYDFYTWGEAGPGQWVTSTPRTITRTWSSRDSATTRLRARAAVPLDGGRAPARRATSPVTRPACRRAGSMRSAGDRVGERALEREAIAQHPFAARLALDGRDPDDRGRQLLR